MTTKKVHYSPRLQRIASCSGKCAFGDKTPHFNSMEEGEKWLSEQAKKEHGEVPAAMSKKSRRRARFTKKIAEHDVLKKTGDAFRSEGISDPVTNNAYAAFIVSKSLPYPEGMYAQITASMAEQANRIRQTEQGQKAYERLSQISYNPYAESCDEHHPGATLPKGFAPGGYASPEDMRDYARSIGADGQLATERPAHGEGRRAWDDDNFPLVDHVQRSVNWINSLTPEEHDAVSAWTSSAPRIGGAALGDKSSIQSLNRNAKKDEDRLTQEDYESYLRVMDGAVAKAAKADGTKRIVWRGYSQGLLAHKLGFSDGHAWLRGDDSLKFAQEHYKVGDEVSFDTFASCSDDSGSALSFSTASNIVYEVETRKSAAVSAVSSWYASEREAIVPRDAKFKVVGVEIETFTRRGGDSEKDVVVIKLQDVE